MGRKTSAYTKNIKRGRYKAHLKKANEERKKRKEERVHNKELCSFQNDEDIQDAGPSNQVPEETLQIKQQEVCMQIKSSLQKLRRKSNPEPEKPLLELEVFAEPQKLDIDIDDTHGFEDESIEDEEPLTESDSKQATKRKIDNLLSAKPKKVKRNPRRKVVIKRLQEESIKAARNAPVIEKVFVDTPKSQDENNSTECADVPTSLQQKERLYEFGKFVAEQLMTFNQKDVEEAQTEIKEVLKKYRLKYKILNCLTKTSPSEPPSTDKSKVTNTVVSNGQPKTKTEPKQGSITVQPVAQSSILRKAALLKAASSKISKPKTQVNSTVTQVAQTKPNVTHPVTDVAKQGTSTCAAQPALVQTSSLVNLALGTGNVPLSLVLVPSADGSLKLTTARVDSTGAVITFPNAPRVNIEAIPPNLTHPVIPVASNATAQAVTKLGQSQQAVQMPQTSGIVQQTKQVLTNTVSQLDNTQARVESNTQESLIENPNIADGITLDPLKVEPSDTIDEESESEIDKQTMSVNQSESETVVFKCEMSSDDDDC